MSAIKTTITFPKPLWIEFQGIVGKKKASKYICEMIERMIRIHNTKKLLARTSDTTWNDSYLQEMFDFEMQALQSSNGVL